MGLRQALARRADIVAIALLVVAAACGSELPTAPRIATPPPPAAPPTAPLVDVDWASLARLFDDPLYRDLPRLLENQHDAARLSAGVTQLIAGIRSRNIDMVGGALPICAEGRQSYFRSPSYHPREGSLLVALSVTEMRARAFLPSVGQLTLEAPVLAPAAGQ